MLPFKAARCDTLGKKNKTAPAAINDLPQTCPLIPLGTRIIYTDSPKITDGKYVTLALDGGKSKPTFPGYLLMNELHTTVF